MDTLKDIAARQQAKRPTYYEDAQKDHMLAIILELAEEVCVLKSELETAYLLAAQEKAVNPEAVAAFAPDSSLQEQRLQEYTQYFENVLARLNDHRKPSDV